MFRIYSATRRFFRFLNLLFAAIGACFLLAITAMICYEVILRALGAPSRLWVIEMSEYALLFIAFLGAPWLLEKNKHVTLDLLYDNLRGNIRRLVCCLNALIGLAVCVVLGVAGIAVVEEQFAVGVREVTVLRPLSGMITIALPIGMILMAVQFLDRFLCAAMGMDTGEEAGRAIDMGGRPYAAMNPAAAPPSSPPRPPGKRKSGGG